MLLRVPALIIKYLFEVEMFIFGIIVNRVIFLVVKPQAGRMFCSSLVSHGLNEVFALVNNYFVGLGGVIFIFEIKLIGREGLNGEVGGKDGSIFCHDVGCFCDIARSKVIKVGLICFCHRGWI